MSIVPLLPARVSVLFRGQHGIGKSQIVRQLAEVIAEKEGINDFEVIDRRLSQMSEGDVIGLPSTDGQVTRFNPPDWYKRACDKPCLLFLDELNRATLEVMQAAFQIALDGELNGWKLHEQSRVFSAVNSSAEYTVNEIDPALLDRFWVCDLKPTAADWREWAERRPADKGGPLDESILAFFRQPENEVWLDPSHTGEAGHVDTSRRSWERLNDALVKNKIIDQPDDPKFYPLCLGFVGVEATIKFHAFAKSMDRQVSGEQIINDWKKVEKRVKKFTINDQNAAIEAVAAFALANYKAFTDKQALNVKAFMETLPDELKLGLWTAITKTGTEHLELTKSLHKHVVQTILDVFGVKAGEAGIGMTPKIPNVFQQKNDKK